MTDDIFPKDVYHDSGYRLPLPKREELPDQAKKVYDLLLSPDGGSLAGLRGPGGIRLHSPRGAVYNSQLARYLRYETGFTGQVRELAILVAAREMDSQFEWMAHEIAALKEGVSPALIDIVKHRKGIEGLPETEAVIIAFGRQVFREKRVASELFARAHTIFGDKGLVDLVSLMGMYAMTAVLLAAFDIQLREGEKPLLPIS